MHSFGSVYSNHIILWVYQFHCVIRIHASDPYSHTCVSRFPNMVPNNTADNWIPKMSPQSHQTLRHIARETSLRCSSTLNIILDDKCPKWKKQPSVINGYHGNNLTKFCFTKSHNLRTTRLETLWQFFMLEIIDSGSHFKSFQQFNRVCFLDITKA